jgi:hypothetical protein
MRSKKIILLVLVFIVLIVGLLAFSLTRKSANITFTMSPSVATAKLDGTSTLKPGKLYIKPGKHTITATFAGFDDKSVSFEAVQGSMKTISVFLVSNSPEGDAWLKNHPEEASNRQAIGSTNFNDEAAQRLAKYPIIKDLPFLGPASEYRIDYGVNPDNSDPLSVGIYITYYTDGGKQDALDWMQQQGFNPSGYTITYTDDTSDQPTTNNPHAN